MKFFKSLKTWLASALCATLVLSGVTAVSTLTANATEGDNTSTEVTLSADVQKVLDAFNDMRGRFGGKTTGTTAEYVKDYVLNDGVTKTSGILVSTDNTNGAKEAEPIVYPNIKINYGALKVGPTHASAFGFVALADNKGTADITRFSPHFFNSDGTAGFAFVLNHNNASTVKVGGVRVLNATAYAGYQGVYYHNYPQYTYYLSDNATRGNAAENIIYSFSEGFNKPFDVWYENSTNLLYATPSNSHGQKDKTYIAGLLSADPTKLTSYNANYTNPFASVDGVQNFSSNYSGAFKSNLVFNGFDNNEGYIGIRFNALIGHKSSFIVTSYAGLDLTNPQATFSGDVLVADNTAPLVTDSYAIPAPKYVNAISETTATAFNGTVNVYAGERSFKYSYTALGAAKASVTDDLGEAIVTGKSVGDTIDISTAGKYTLEYVDANGQKAYSTIIANEGVEVTSLDNVNTTITVNGNELTTGTKLAVGDVLKVVPNENYTVYNFKPSDNEDEAFVLNGKTTALDANNEYVVTANDLEVGSFDIISAAYKAKYALGFARFDGTYATQYIYEGIDCAYYRFGNSGAWLNGKFKRNGKNVYSFYAVYHYDGEKVYIGGYIDGTLPTNGTVTGYTVTKADGTPIGIAKVGLTDVQGFRIYGDTNITPIVNVSWLETTKIKTKGTKGLQVNLYVNKTAVDSFENGFVEYTKDNEYGYTATAANPVLKAVVVKGSAYDTLSQIVQTGSGSIGSRSLDDSYGWTTFASVDEFKGNMTTLELKNRTITTIDSVDYYSYSIVIPFASVADFNETYYVGAYLNYGSFNGGDFARLGQKSKTSMIEHGYFDAAKKSYYGENGSSKISVVDNGEKYSYTFGNVTYYSNEYQSYEIKTIVSAYVNTHYVKGVSLTEVEGYKKHATKDIWYSAEVFGEETSDAVIDTLVETYNAI